jgi:epoxyqueuosine reductase
LKKATKRRSDEATKGILARCRELGFALTGVASADSTQYEREFRDWIAAGRHGEMGYLAERLELRLDPRRLLPGARSVICVADRYHDGAPDPEASSADRGRIARYARGDDYHTVMKKRLRRLCDELAARYPAERFRVCVDTAPVLERELAQRAGLGAVGKHTLLIEPGVGSYLLLGEVVTTLALSPSVPCSDDPCGSCTRCIDACPTDAITPWSLDATRCLSYLTIEHRSAIDERYHAPMGQWIFGCDVCQEVCPHNQPTERSRRTETLPAYEARHESIELLEILGWDEEARRGVFVRSAMKRAKLAMMKRNALVAAGNRLDGSAGPELRARIETIAADPGEDAMVRATAHRMIEKSRGEYTAEGHGGPRSRRGGREEKKRIERGGPRRAAEEEN